MAISLFNDVLGPIMRGPSSGHTAATWRMGKLTRQLLGGAVVRAECRFHKSGAYANVFRQQRSDLAFAAGLLDLDMADPGYDLALDLAAGQELSLFFTTPELDGAGHPNEVEVAAAAPGQAETFLRFRSLGGGIAALVALNGRPVHYTGDSHAVFIPASSEAAGELAALASRHGGRSTFRANEQGAIVQAEFTVSPDPAFWREVKRMAPDARQAHPLMFVPVAEPDQSLLKRVLFSSPGDTATLAELGQAYECGLLGCSLPDLEPYLGRCHGVMAQAVEQGMAQNNPKAMRLAPPLAVKIARAVERGLFLTGGIHTRAATRALAAAEWNAAGGLVCAAPTAGSGGVLPAVLVTMEEDLGMPKTACLHALWTAGAVGLAIAHTYTFAGGVGGCQVEMGAAGAMAAAALVEAAILWGKDAPVGKQTIGWRGRRSGCDARTPASTEQKPEHASRDIRGTALNAATLFLHNCIGLACDPVQGYVEVPCLSRNASAASQALLCADLALAGWRSPISFHDTLLALKDAGERMPSALRCTSIGGLASRSPSQ